MKESPDPGGGLAGAGGAFEEDFAFYGAVDERKLVVVHIIILAQMSEIGNISCCEPYLKIFKIGLNRPYLFGRFCIYIGREMMHPRRALDVDNLKILANRQNPS